MKDNLDLLRNIEVDIGITYELKVISINSVRIDNEIYGIFYNTPSKEFVDSISKEGVKNPIKVLEEGEHYRIIDGNKRVLGCMELRIREIPALIYSDTLTELEIIKIQIISNIRREKRDALWEGNIYFRYLKQTLGVDLIKEATNKLMWYRIKDGRCTSEDVSIINTLLSLAGKKSTKSIESRIRLLLLPTVILEALLSKEIGLTTAYTLAENVDDPSFDSVCQRIFRERLTALDVKKLFHPISPYSQCEKVIKKMSSILSEEFSELSSDELSNLQIELDNCLNLIKSSFRIEADQSLIDLGSDANAEQIQ